MNATTGEELRRIVDGARAQVKTEETESGAKIRIMHGFGPGKYYIEVKNAIRNPGETQVIKLNENDEVTANVFNFLIKNI
jgi:hypothetical protein